LLNSTKGVRSAVVSQSEEGRPEFGTGLRAYLGRFSPERVASEPESVAPEPEPSALQAPPFLDREARLFLAHRVEEHAESLWAVFADALAATTSDGRPDHRTRMLAARTLLAEALGPGARRQGKRPRVQDELAELRRRRAVR
jgi:hypothetical protein